MKQKPLVSITCMTYNHEQYIGQAIESFLMQKTTFLYEILIGEDCSTDDTLRIVNEYVKKSPEKIRLITSPSNVGPRKNGIRLRDAARGKYIAICEGDDYWTDPLKLQKQVNFLEQNPDVCVVYHNNNVVDSTDRLIKEGKEGDETIIMGGLSLFHVWIPPLTAVFKNCIKSYPPEYMDVFNGDAFLFGMLSSYGNVAKMGFVGAAYRKHSGGTFSGRSYFENCTKSIETRRKMLTSAFFDQKQVEEIRKAIWNKKKVFIKYYLKRGLVSQAFRILFM